MSNASVTTDRVITRDALLAHWQGHRRLTRRVIEAFAEDQLFTFSLGGMRTFGEMALEMIAMAAPMAEGVATMNWGAYTAPEASSKAGVLELWDASTPVIDRLWADIPIERFQETITAFGQYTGPTYDLLLYVIDNEIHHRGQGYLYLRALGIEPPPFWERD